VLPGLSSSSGIEPLGRIDVVDASPRALVLLLDPKVVVEVASSDPLTGPGQGRTLVDLTLTRGRGVPVEALQTGVFDDLSVFDELLVRDPKTGLEQHLFDDLDVFVAGANPLNAVMGTFAGTALD